MRRLKIAVMLLLAFVGSTSAQESVIVRALEDELARSMASLRLPDEPPPYYIAYTLEDLQIDTVRAMQGALVRESRSRLRMLAVEVRVGSHEFDSSRFVSFDAQAGLQSGFAAGLARCPLDDDYDEIRRQAWIATDAAYKRAVNNLSGKKAAFQNRVEKDPIPDFSKEDPFQSVRTGAAPAAPGRAWTDLTQQLSAVFLKAPDISSSAVQGSSIRGTHHFLTSAGTRVVTPISRVTLRIAAETQADDGMFLRDFVVEVGRTVDDLPAGPALLARTRALADRLTTLRRASVGEEFTGPVLVEDQAARELLAQKLVPLFLALRAPETGGNMPFMMPDSLITPFLTRIGSRVLPDSMTVRDTPSLARHGTAAVAGAYAVDDEGIPAKDVLLVKDGMLATLLTSRTPQKNLLRSNGHGRAGVAQAGVFEVEARNGVPAAALKQRYLELLKQQGRAFGYIVRRVSNPIGLQVLTEGESGVPQLSGPGGRAGGLAILSAVRVTPDGKEEDVRGLTFGNITHTSFREIPGASSDRVAYNYLARPSLTIGMPTFSADLLSGGTPVTIIGPDLLFDELDVQPATDVLQKPPIVPSPLKR
ncbi:MAG: hypothetical protein HYS05_20055 [Acidobacteria bacterium]|nr:hypothetical protein [Acidobacteriota bacterium]